MKGEGTSEEQTGAEGSRTPDLNNANVAFYQTKLRPRIFWEVLR